MTSPYYLSLRKTVILLKAANMYLVIHEHGRQSEGMRRYQPDASSIDYVKHLLSKYQPGVWKSLSLKTSWLSLHYKIIDSTLNSSGCKNNGLYYKPAHYQHLVSICNDRVNNDLFS
jgi:hypothetical protein